MLSAVASTERTISLRVLGLSGLPARVEADDVCFGREAIDVNRAAEIGEDRRAAVTARGCVAVSKRPDRHVMPPLGELRRVDRLLVQARSGAAIAAVFKDVAGRSRVGELLEAVGHAAGRGVVDARVVIEVETAIDFEHCRVAVGVDVADRVGLPGRCRQRDRSRIESQRKCVVAHHVEAFEPRRAVVGRSRSGAGQRAGRARRLRDVPCGGATP